MNNPKPTPKPREPKRARGLANTTNTGREYPHRSGRLCFAINKLTVLTNFDLLTMVWSSVIYVPELREKQQLINRYLLEPLAAATMNGGSDTFMLAQVTDETLGTNRIR